MCVLDVEKDNFCVPTEAEKSWNERLRGSLTNVVGHQVKRRPNIASAIEEFGVSILLMTQVGIKFPVFSAPSPKQTMNAIASFLAFLVDQQDEQDEQDEQGGGTGPDDPPCQWMCKIEEDRDEVAYSYFFAELSFASRRTGPFAVRVMVNLKEVFDNIELIKQKQILDVPLMIMVHGTGRRESICHSARVWASMLPGMRNERTYFHPQLFFVKFFGSSITQPSDFYNAIQCGFFSGIEAYFSDEFFSSQLFKKKPPLAPIQAALQSAYSALTRNCLEGPLSDTMGETVRKASQRLELLRLTFKSCGFVSSKTVDGVEFMRHKQGARTSSGCILHAKWHHETNTVLLTAKKRKGCDDCQSCKSDKNLDILKHIRYVARRIPAYLNWPVLVCEKLPDGTFKTKFARHGDPIGCALCFIVEGGAMNLFEPDASKDVPPWYSGEWKWLQSFM